MRDWGKHIGEKFDRLTIMADAGIKARKNGLVQRLVTCKCDCGNIRNYFLYNVKSGNTKSCGCLRKENGFMNPSKIRLHGFSRTPIYKRWLSMKDRCMNPHANYYKNYGGRGIAICEEWLNNPAAFINWALANGYKKGLEIDRIDNNGNYTPENCRFVTHSINGRNTRRTKFYTYKGETKTLPEWMETLNLNYRFTLTRLSNGFDFASAVELPKRNYNHSTL